jgi:hypothetical protein
VMPTSGGELETIAPAHACPERGLFMLARTSPGAQSGGRHASIVRGRYWVLAEGFAPVSSTRESTKPCRFRPSARSFCHDPFLGWPPEIFQDMSFAIRGSTSSGSTSEPASLTHDGL